MTRAKCEQKCGEWAAVYAVDPIPSGWGGHYCEPCAAALRFHVVDVYGPCCRDCGTGESLRRVMVTDTETDSGCYHMVLCLDCLDQVTRRAARGVSVLSFSLDGGQA
jgi:hypothetical protein